MKNTFPNTILKLSIGFIAFFAIQKLAFLLDEICYTLLIAANLPAVISLWLSIVVNILVFTFTFIKTAKYYNKNYQNFKASHLVKILIIFIGILAISQLFEYFKYSISPVQIGPEFGQFDKDFKVTARKMYLTSFLYFCHYVIALTLIFIKRKQINLH